MLERMWRKGNLPPILLVGMYISTTTIEYSMEVPQKTKYRTTSNPIPRHMSGQTFSETDTCGPMFIAALLTIVKTWKQPKCPVTDEWIKKTWCI